MALGEWYVYVRRHSGFAGIWRTYLCRIARYAEHCQEGTNEAPTDVGPKKQKYLPNTMR